MIEEVGRLGRETLVILRIRRDDDLDRFLAHLLRDGRNALVEEADGVGAFRPLSGPVRHDGGEPGEQVSTGVLSGQRQAVRTDRPGKAGAVPVWQAGPACSTRYSTASASQSSRISRTDCTWPEEPLRQSPFRDLL